MPRRSRDSHAGKLSSLPLSRCPRLYLLRGATCARRQETLVMTRTNQNAWTEEPRMNRYANFQLTLASACSYASVTRHALGVSACLRVSLAYRTAAAVRSTPCRDPESKRSDSSPRVRSARSVTSALATPVHAAMAGDRIGYYSRRQRQSTSGASFPGVRSRPPTFGMPRGTHTPVRTRCMPLAGVTRCDEPRLRRRRGSQGHSPKCSTDANGIRGDGSWR